MVHTEELSPLPVAFIEINKFSTGPGRLDMASALMSSPEAEALEQWISEDMRYLTFDASRSRGPDSHSDAVARSIRRPEPPMPASIDIGQEQASAMLTVPDELRDVWRTPCCFRGA